MAGRGQLADDLGSLPSDVAEDEEGGPHATPVEERDEGIESVVQSAAVGPLVVVQLDAVVPLLEIDGERMAGAHGVGSRPRAASASGCSGTSSRTASYAA